MRLTLRTLLAYMDDILDPTDHEELGKRIEASDFAAELIHRSRDTVRRLRLGAPEVFAGEDDDVLNPDPASDANTVAEYLDNTLPPEQVADFERVCLESGTTADMHLAEVTSCHHVLTMVLGEPAEIDPQVRRRMYELPYRAETPHQTDGGDKLRIEPSHTPAQVAQEPQPIISPAAISPPAAPAHATVPDYLRVAANQRRRWQRMATAAVLMIMGGITAYLVSGAFEEPQTSSEVEEALKDGNIDIEELDVAIDTPADAVPSPETGLVAGGVAEDRFNNQVPPADDAMATLPSANDTPADVPAVEPPSTAFDSSTTAPAAPSVLDPPATTGLGEQLPTTTDGGASTALAMTESGMPLPPQGTIEQPATIEPENTAIEVDTVVGASDPTIPGDPLGIEPDVDSDDEADETPAPKGPMQLGSYPGNNDVVLRFRSDTNQWFRLPERSPIVVGDTLLVLPKYRTLIGLDTASLYVFGGTQFTLPAPPQADGTGDMRLPIELSFGRLQLNANHKGSQFVLKIGPDLREFDLDPSASLAVEAHRLFVPGTDYETESGAVEVVWYLTSGKLTWRNPDGSEQTFTAPAIWKTINGVDSEVQTAADWPKWIEKDDVSSLERRARERLDGEIPFGEPVNLRISELNDATYSNRETRSLSAEASLYIGVFEPFIKSLNDSDQDASWNNHIVAMRQAMARSPLTAAKLREDFVRERGEQAGADLLAMMRGFTPEQVGRNREELKQGVVLDLVRWLEHDSLDYRVLAIYNLDEIKGSKNLKNYQPDGIPRTRAIAVSKIRQMIENNEFLNLPP